MLLFLIGVSPSTAHLRRPSQTLSLLLRRQPLSKFQFVIWGLDIPSSLELTHSSFQSGDLLRTSHLIPRSALRGPHSTLRTPALASSFAALLLCNASRLIRLNRRQINRRRDD